jgi:hypothetical protein
MGVGTKPLLKSRPSISPSDLDPRAPAFSGGHGYFRVAQAPGPAGRTHLDGRHRPAPRRVAVAGVAAHPTNPPPETEAVSFPPMLVETAGGLDVEINVEIKPDANLSGKGAKAETSITGLPQANYEYTVTNGRVTKFTFTWKGTLSIQTSYPANFSPTDTSAYGRGTGADVDAGNVTLGFHESCHRNDYQAYIAKSDELARTGHTTPYVLPDSSPPVTVPWNYVKFPRFKGRTGQTESDFKKAFKNFDHEETLWTADLHKFSRRCTDEFGTKKSDYERHQKHK